MINNSFLPLSPVLPVLFPLFLGGGIRGGGGIACAAAFADSFEVWPGITSISGVSSGGSNSCSHCLRIASDSGLHWGGRISQSGTPPFLRIAPVLPGKMYS